MPQFQLTTSGKVRPLGKYDSLEEVGKLRLFRDNPNLMQFVSEVSKPVKRYNRWRVIMAASYYDLLGSYTKAEVVLLTPSQAGRLRLVHRYEYHESDGRI